MASITDVQETLSTLQRHCMDFQGLTLICRDGDKLVFSRVSEAGEFVDALQREFVAVLEGHLGDRVDLVPVEDYLDSKLLDKAG